MKNSKTIISLLLITVATILSARGGQGRRDINPALQYYQAFLVGPDLAETDRDYLFNTEWRGQKLPDRFADLVARYDNQFKLVRQAAQATVPSDWGIDMTPGPATLLPHLARNRGIAQAARLRVLWHLQQGRPAEARDDLLAAFALARRTSGDGTLISMLVQIAAENILCLSIAENFHLFPSETLKELAQGIDTAPARGTAAGSIPFEKRFFLDWLIGKIEELQKANPGNEEKVMTGIRELLVSMEDPEEGKTASGKPSLWEKVSKASGGTSAGVLKLLHDDAPLYDRLAQVLSLPHAEYEGQIKKLSAEIEKSSNPFISETFPAVEKCRPKEFAILVELAMVRAAVEYKLNGETGLKSVSDPCGEGPFAFQRFNFEGVDRGFLLRSAYTGRGFPEVLIFVEKEGPAFQLNGKNAGQPVPNQGPK